MFNFFSKFDLTSAVSYEDAVEACESLGLKNVDEDKLYDETRKNSFLQRKLVGRCGR